MKMEILLKPCYNFFIQRKWGISMEKEKTIINIFKYWPVLFLVLIFIMGFIERNAYTIIIDLILTVSVAIRFTLNINLIFKQNNENIENQKVGSVVRMTNENVEKQFINTGDSHDLCVIKNIRKTFDPIVQHAHHFGKFDYLFFGEAFDELDIFLTNIETTAYTFDNLKMKNVLDELKSIASDFYNIYIDNTEVLNGKHTQFTHVDLLLKIRTTQNQAIKKDLYKKYEKAILMKEKADELVSKMLIKYEEVNEKYRNEFPPHGVYS